MNIIRRIQFFALIQLFIFAKPSVGQSTANLVNAGKVPAGFGEHHLPAGVRAAACAPATALRDLEWNNISALIENGGLLWLDRANGRGKYYAPKNGGVSVMYAGSLWLAGLSPDQQLKLSALIYRYSGNDYWPGPLTNDGTAEVTESTCQDWDKFYVSYRQDAQLHRQYHECANDPECDLADFFPDGYTTPAYFENYPAHGQTSLGQDFYLAPYKDFDESGHYNPEAGDYPYYDFLHDINCAQRTREGTVPLYGDQTYYWIFNDKGNVHSESGGQPIGMEIRAQAFAFSTNDEVNNMTFYNYVLINQGTQTLTETYFGTWTDCDIGGEVDDYVGCDVQRGLGYGYNADAFDAPTGLSLGYGDEPPCVGVDYFEGPYQDEDDEDNPLTADINQAIAEKGIPYKGIGIGYGDGIPDNERFGMRKFLYHGSGAGPSGLPEQAVHFYNYMRGFWKNGQRMAYGGNALTTSSGANLQIEADFMFPGDTDPYHFGTLGSAVEPWDEVSSGNPAGDRRFLQSSGPFTLEPGDYNNITVGVVWAANVNGSNEQTVNAMRLADDKAQALFDNCFELISGPDAPDVTVQELENELILLLRNESIFSSNYHESYVQPDPTIPEIFDIGDTLTELERSYLFQGYIIYQLADETVSSSELNDINKARLIAQCDIQDGIADIVNFEKDTEIGEVIPVLKVQGADEGIQHSFRITEDAFALGNAALVNHKTYYFMCIAYGYNNFSNYDIANARGQDKPFIASRKAAFSNIPVIKAIPHATQPEAGGTYLNASYGYELPLRQIEGKGNATNFLNITTDVEKEILANNRVAELQYTTGASPVSVRIVDPLRVPVADFDLRLAPNDEDVMGDSAHWQLINTTTDEVYDSHHSIHLLMEELLPEWGLSVTWHQYDLKNDDLRHFTGFVGSALQFDNPSQAWLAGIADDDSYTPFNWIMSGSTWVLALDNELEAMYNDYDEGPNLTGSDHNVFSDENEEYEGAINGTWSPYCLVSAAAFNTELQQWFHTTSPTVEDLRGDLSQSPHLFSSAIKNLNNVDIVLTNDTSLWTRCAVFEMQNNPLLSEGGVEKMQMRSHASVDKMGIASGQSGCNEQEATRGGTQPVGMSWFPGYAIDVGTGTRLNMAFGEDSWLTGEHGRDMIWNPTTRLMNDIGTDYLFGGQHWIYVFRDMRHEYDEEDYMPHYDHGQFIYGLRDAEGALSIGKQKDIFSACSWVGSALLNDGFDMLPMAEGLVPSGVRVQLRVAKPYTKYDDSTSDMENYKGATNWWNGRYTFTTRGLHTVVNDQHTLSNVMEMINVVPNPYYAFSAYETGKLDNRIKITNLPQFCTVSIYDLNGVLIRQFEKADPLTSLDWDLKNAKNIPVSSGTYIIHIVVPGVGEKVLKWFGVMRPVDLDNY
ncbi:MAG: T9SS type A sorting domain-containing protein [Flavobacteriales bacterium]